MAEELSKIEKPPVSQFEKGRRLLFVPLIIQQTETSVEYAGKLQKYWTQVEEQIKNFESKLGKISRVYHEFLLSNGSEGLEELKKISETTGRITGELLAKGASLEVLEDKELLSELSDWYRCLSAGLENQKVFSQVYESYRQAGTKRNAFTSKHIDETLLPDEIGILFVSEQSKLTFPQGIEIFYFAPPALDEINRWMREHVEAGEDANPNEEK